MNSNPVLTLIIALITALSSVLLPTASAPSDKVAFYGAASATQRALVSDYAATVFSDGTCKITKYKGAGEEITVPFSINGATVTSIGEFAFSECHSLKKVTLPITVKTVERGAFNLCDSLTSIEVSAGNKSLASFDGVLYSSDFTRLVAFPGGKGGSFVIPETVTEVCDYAFDHVYRLTSVNMYNSVTKIGAHAFSFCWNVRSLRLSDRLSVLGEEAFSYCNGITEYHLPASLTSIGADAFLGTISSNGDRQYYFVDGIYCVPGTYSYNYVKNLGVEVSSDVRSITDIDSGLVIYDISNSLPYNADLCVTALDTDESTYGFKKYTTYSLFEVSLKNGDKKYTPKSDVTLSFNLAKPDAPNAAIKLYSCTDDNAHLIFRQPLDMDVSVSFSGSGKYALLSGTDFSLKGDCDGDGTVTTYDALTALYGAIGVARLTDAQKAACDIDSNGVISTSDAISILRFAVGIEDF